MNSISRFLHIWLDASASKKFIYDEAYKRGYKDGKREAEEPRRESVCPNTHLYPVHLVPDPERYGAFLCPECMLVQQLQRTEPIQLREQADPLMRLVNISCPPDPGPTTEPTRTLQQGKRLHACHLEREQPRLSVYVHHALEEGYPINRAIAEYQHTQHAPAVRLPERKDE